MKAANTDTILIEEEFYVPAESPWRAWTEPSLIMQWFGSDPNGKVLTAEMDVYRAVLSGSHSRMLIQQSIPVMVCTGM